MSFVSHGTTQHGFTLTVFRRWALASCFQPVLHDWCNKDCGMCYPVCGMMHLKEPLLLIVANVAAGGFLSRYLSGTLPYFWRHITLNNMC